MGAGQEQDRQHEWDTSGVNRQCGCCHEPDLEQLQRHDNAALRKSVSYLARVGREKNVRQYEKGVAVGDQPTLAGERGNRVDR